MLWVAFLHMHIKYNAKFNVSSPRLYYDGHEVPDQEH